MGQQPNIELEMADLPRPVPAPAPARRWAPNRPGELGSPADVPWGGMFGTPGPDSGFTLVLIRALDLPLGEGESRADVEVALAALAGARASHFGRAPTREDVEVATILLGFDAARPAGHGEERSARFARLAHDPARARRLVASVAVDVLAAQPDDLRSRLAAGRRLGDL